MYSSLIECETYGNWQNEKFVTAEKYAIFIRYIKILPINVGNAKQGNSKHKRFDGKGTLWTPTENQGECRLGIFHNKSLWQ